MQYPIQHTTGPIVPDTLPALKICHYTGTARQGNIYSYARLWYERDTLRAQCLVFERQAAATRRVCVALCGSGGDVLAAVTGPDNGMLYRVPRGTSPAQIEALCEPFAPLQVQRSEGEDEQGWYWGAVMDIPAEALGACTVDLQSFGTGVFLYDLAEDALGASCPCVALCPECFTPCTLLGER